MSNIEKGSLNRSLLRYGVAIFAAAGGFLLRLLIEGHFGTGLPTYITFYPAVMLSAVVGGFWSGLAATTLSILITVYWILSPCRRDGSSQHAAKGGIYRRNIFYSLEPGRGNNGQSGMEDWIGVCKKQLLKCPDLYFT
jgi:hypothetical protein